MLIATVGGEGADGGGLRPGLVGSLGCEIDSVHLPSFFEFHDQGGSNCCEQNDRSDATARMVDFSFAVKAEERVVGEKVYGLKH